MKAYIGTGVRPAWSVWWSLFWIAMMLSAQEPQVVREGDIVADVSTTFITAYKPGNWVPIDVVLHNNKEDISGYLEVTVVGSSGTTSPIYRVPVESPKGSRKRFRVYSNLTDAQRISAMVYEKGRPALDLPIAVRLLPLDERDRIGLILDDEPADYGFLYTAVQRADREAGLHRHELRTEELPQLPDRPQCYDAYSLIVFGQIDPGQIGLRQRELMERYVRKGGVLVICTGENASRFRGTWVEDLSGVSMGAQLTVDEQTLAAEVFDNVDRTGGRAGRDILITELTRGSADTERLGRDRVLATRRPLGSGYVVTVAVDAHGKALQQCSGFLRLWSDLAAREGGGASLNYAKAANTASQTLPSATGVRVYPWSSVLIYLLAYFFIGIVGNWLFWNWMKRREMAWVCLVFFSLGFTAYALIYGTAGRAKATEIAELEVLHVPQDGGVGEKHSIVGLLSARTARYDLDLTHEYGMVSDSWSQSFQPFTRARRGLFSQSDAFTFTYDTPPRIENLRVGASVMRVFEVASDFEPEGGIDGDLVWDRDGIHGTLTNNTGYAIEDPFLILEGRRIALPQTGHALEVNVSVDRLEQRDFLFDANRPNYYYGYSQIDQQTLQGQFFQDLIARPGFEDTVDPRLGPFLCAWIVGTTPDVIRTEEPMQRQIVRSLLVADIQLNQAQATLPAQVPLDILVNEMPSGSPAPYRMGLRQRMIDFQPSASNSVEAQLPHGWQNSHATELQFEIWIYTDAKATIQFAPVDASGNETPPGSPGFQQAKASEWQRVDTPDGTASVATFRFSNWKTFADPQNNWFKANIRFTSSENNNQQVYGSFLPLAYLTVPRQASTTGDWHPWQ